MTESATTPVPETPGIIERYRWCAGLLLAGLLGGYLVFNKPFALMGSPPLYIGECVLLLTLPALLLFIKRDVWRVLTESWGMACVGAFFAYGVGRVIHDWNTYGMLAARDGIVAGYAIVAFLAPALWRPRESASDAERPALELNRRETLAHRVFKGLVPLAILGGLWSAAVSFGYINLSTAPWTENKPDFTTLAAAVAAWMLFVLALRHHPLRRGSGAQIGLRLGIFLLAMAAAVGAALVVKRLPTRAVWVSAAPLAGLCFLVWTSRRAVQIMLFCLAAMGILAGALMLMPEQVKAAQRISSEYQLTENLDWSIDELEAQLREHPETYPAFDVNFDVATTDPESLKERLGSILNPNEKSFSTQAGQRGAHANLWRMIFWQRTFNYTWRNARAAGIGMGPNITNLNRHTPAWPMFIPAMSVGLRTPHSAHLTIFARLGLVGAGLWALILGLTAWKAIEALWAYRAVSVSLDIVAEDRARHRETYFDLLGLFGVWLIYLTTMSLSVTLENPMGGMPFWALTGVLLRSAIRV